MRDYNFEEPNNGFVKYYLCAVIVIITGISAYIFGSIQ